MNLKKWMKENKISQQELAKMTGKNQSAVSQWVRGNTIPRAEVMKQIIRLTGGQVTPADFYTDEA